VQASGNNYKMIFLLASAVSAAACLAFIFLVPNHTRPGAEAQVEARRLKKAQQQREKELRKQQRASGVSVSAPSTSSSSSAPLQAPLLQAQEQQQAGSQQQPQQQQQQQQQKGLSIGKFFQDCKAMGSDFYRMLLIVSMYGMGHIGEVRGWLPVAV
jgi:hypothetical protein